MAVAGGAASATTVDIDKVTHSVFKDENAVWWFVATDVMLGNQTRNNVGAGAFHLTMQDANDPNGLVTRFIAFCLEPIENLRLSVDYEMGSRFSQSIIDELNILASNALGLIEDKFDAAAFQMAAWEIAQEGGADYNVTDGNFKVTRDNYQSDTAEDIAQTWLDEMNAGNWAAGETYLQLYADGTQDLLTNIPEVTGGPVVPLPASVIMMMSAFAAAGIFGARRKDTSAV